ncbi:fumarate reductase subunit C [Kribbella pittospori]|uniref:Fumarate reductase subunit C n=1 Tax=Kribbella pittospori TaxID=722689 RepID=A0A4R0KV87_9ACTN|nr:fumarate reductase subunit C [Kribbella pittospori]TCC62228.1 fumarate reductase subunit C [Kribbella pittospori]
MSVYERPVHLLWWLERRSYLLFVLRELSSVFVAWTVVYLLLLVNAVSDGPTSYQRFLDRSGEWWMVAINVITMLFLLLHVVTWFGLAPRAMVVKARGHRVPPRQIVAAHYLAWLVLSAIVAWLVLR